MISIQKSASRLFVCATITQGSTLALSKDQSHYLIRVMRRGVGDDVIVFNGHEGEWVCKIIDASKSSCLLSVQKQLRPQNGEPDIWLAFAPLKKSRMDFLVEKSCELGVSRLLPILTQNTDVARINRERLQASAIEAAEQCERLSVPAVDAAIALNDLIADWDQTRRLLYLDETGKGQPLAAVLLQDSDNEHPIKDGFLVGPEGGFSAQELVILKTLPFAIGIGLGPRILRAETAALAALACWQSIVGDTCNSRLR